MSNFMYFLPGIDTKTDAITRIKAAGLGYAFGEEELSRGAFGFNKVGTILGNESGAIVTPGVAAKDGEVASGIYDADNQTWTRAPKALGDWWLGRDRPPVRPVDLQRANPLDGTRVRLGDGQEWLVPAARLWPKAAPFGISAFPQKLVYGDDGWQVEELSRWATLSRHADRLMSIRDGDVDIEEVDAISMAVDILAVNYRVGPVEISALELLTTSQTGTLTKVFDAFLGFPQLRAMLTEEAEAAKKNSHPPVTAGDGSPAGGPD